MKYFFLALLVLGCSPDKPYYQAPSPKLMNEMWLGEQCLDRPDLFPLVSKAWACILNSRIAKAPRVCIVEDLTTCTGWFANGVLGCAGGRGIVVSLESPSLPDMLVHEMLKWLVITGQTDLPSDLGESIVFHDGFRAAELLAMRCL